MKKYFILFIVLGLMVGCGSSKKSVPNKDSKGEIDIVGYLPSENMIKHFSYGVTLLYSGIGRREIEVLDNKIEITQYSSTISPFVSPEVVQNKLIVYNDINITGFYEDLSGRFGDINYTTYRYVDINDSLIIDQREYTSEYYDGYVGMVIGTEYHELSNKCFYKEITDKVFDSYGNIKKEGGDYLLIECTEEETVTYYINSEYQNLTDIDGTSTYDTTKRVKYYEKGIGYIAESTEGDTPYNYFVHNIEY